MIGFIFEYRRLNTVGEDFTHPGSFSRFILLKLNVNISDYPQAETTLSPNFHLLGHTGNADGTFYV